jgi:predicted ribosome quality control (RQC) complex YloA/Tae2 family protein
VTRIPFDNLVLRAVVAEMQSCVGARVQEIRQPSPLDIAIRVFGKHGEATIFASAHPVFFRMLFATRRGPTITPAPQLLAMLRSRIQGAMVSSVRQIGGDRIAEIEFSHDAEGKRSTLVVELIGTHSNIVLLDEARKIVAAAKWIARSKSSRPIVPGASYERPSLQSGPSPFRTKLGPSSDDRLAAFLARGFGAYPVSVAALGYTEVARPSISIALEEHAAQAIPQFEADALRTQLVGRLDKLVLSRERAIGDLERAKIAGDSASQWQRWAELILAYGSGADFSKGTFEAEDYDGTPVEIAVDPELDRLQNAEKYFLRAKKAKGSMGIVLDQLARLADDRAAILELRERIDQQSTLKGLQELQEEAKRKRWLIDRPVPTAEREDRPYQGHRIRELLAPHGYTVLYGENAESNDFLTLRVAKPDDWWLHVRGGVSAHVVVQTRRKPESVQREVLQFAAEVAVRNSPSKHSGFVAVDYTLRKHVRKPRGAPKGAALYSHEKTLHVDG